MSKAKSTLSKPQPETPPKTPKRPPLHPEAQQIIIQARWEVSRIQEQIGGIKTFNFNVGEEDQALYDFSSAMHTILEMILEHARQLHDLLGVAAGYVPEEKLTRLPWKEVGD